MEPLSVHGQHCNQEFEKSQRNAIDSAFTKIGLGHTNQSFSIESGTVCFESCHEEINRQEPHALLVGRQEKPQSLTTDLIHGSIRWLERARGNPMRCVFALDAGSRNGVEPVIGSPVRDRLSNIPFITPEETIPKFSIGGESQSIAIPAKWFRHRIDETHATSTILETIVIGWLCRIASSERNQRSEMVLQKAAHFFSRYDLIATPLSIRVQGHELNETDEDPPAASKFHQGYAVRKIDPAQDQGIEANVQWSPHRRIDSRDYLIDPLASRHRMKCLLSQRVQRNIDMRKTCIR